VELGFGCDKLVFLEEIFLASENCDFIEVVGSRREIIRVIISNDGVSVGRRGCSDVILRRSGFKIDRYSDTREVRNQMRSPFSVELKILIMYT